MIQNERTNEVDIELYQQILPKQRIQKKGME